MTNYEKLVEALRCCGNEGCHKCPYQKHIHEKFCWVIAMKDAAAAIEALQAELPKQGEWEDYNGHKNCVFKCSVCGSLDFGKYRYCHVCGAKMTEVQE